MQQVYLQSSEKNGVSRSQAPLKLDAHCTEQVLAKHSTAMGQRTAQLDSLCKKSTAAAVIGANMAGPMGKVMKRSIGVVVCRNSKNLSNHPLDGVAKQGICLVSRLLSST